jgi:hypothetical protein
MVCPREAELVNADTTNGGQPRLRLGHRSLFVAQGTIRERPRLFSQNFIPDHRSRRA